VFFYSFLVNYVLPPENKVHVAEPRLLRLIMLFKRTIQLILKYNFSAD